jgi:hypothetical protein
VLKKGFSANAEMVAEILTRQVDLFLKEMQMTRIGLDLMEVFRDLLCCAVFWIDVTRMQWASLCFAGTDVYAMLMVLRQLAINSWKDEPVFFGALELFERFKQEEHLARHGLEVDGQRVMLLHDVGVINFDEGVAQFFGRRELEELVYFPDAGPREAKRRRQDGAALDGFLFRWHKLHLSVEDKKE